MNNRFLLCRPQGGLNDILCQIEKCCRYAEQFGRTVIVDTAYINSYYFRDNFSSYFTSKQTRLILSVDAYANNLQDFRVYPETLYGRLNSYEAYFENKYLAFCDNLSGHPISFDFKQNYSHSLLVHHQCGGGTLSQFALLRLTLKQSIVNELIKRMSIVGGSWMGVHVRNTDYSTDYVSLLNEIKMSSTKKLYLATDSLIVKDRFQNELKNMTVYSMAKLLSSDSKPIHEILNPADNDVYSINIDAILDLLMLSFSKKIYFHYLEPNNNNAKISGFSLLSNNLWNNKLILKYLINDNRINFGLN